MLLNAVAKTIRQYRLINKGEKIVVGVSGGPDSVALLCVLHSLSKEFKISLHIAHLDHMLRKESRKDREFVEKLSGRLKIPVTSAQINVKSLAKGGGSLEEVARNARFAFLFQIAKKVKAKKIALGHNLDDQAETVLMRIIRGTGLTGMSGIMPKRDIAGFQIIRPLIEAPRREIESFLKSKKICACIDRTNFKNIYFRNKIRNRLLPLLEREYNSNIKKVLANMAQIMACDYDFLIKAARQKIKGLGNRIAIDKLLRLHPAMQRLVLRSAIARIQGDLRRITFRHLSEIEDLISSRPTGSIVDLPRGISVVKKKNTLLFYRRNK